MAPLDTRLREKTYFRPTPTTDYLTAYVQSGRIRQCDYAKYFQCRFTHECTQEVQPQKQNLRGPTTMAHLIK